MNKSAVLALDLTPAAEPLLECAAELRRWGVGRPRLETIDYEILVETDESDRRLELLHTNVRQYGTVCNTVAPGTRLTGTLRRA